MLLGDQLLLGNLFKSVIIFITAQCMASSVKLQKDTKCRVSPPAVSRHPRVALDI